MDKSSVTSVVARMEDEGLVERRAKPADKRVVAVYLTQKEREAAARVLDFRAEVDAIAWQGLDAREREELSSLLDRVIENLQASEEGACA